MGIEIEPKKGDTLLSPEELDQLIPKHITNRNQLDEVEQDNIEDAYEWLLSKKNGSSSKLLSRDFMNNLHSKMLGKVWQWAGKIRTRETIIGVFPYQIETRSQQLLDDAIYWVEKTNDDPIEVALRFHHRLVQIHCYPNGNGRHSRIMADLILEWLYEQPALIWAGEDLINTNEFRDQYIAALKLADQGDYRELYNCVKK